MLGYSVLYQRNWAKWHCDCRFCCGKWMSSWAYSLITFIRICLKWLVWIQSQLNEPKNYAFLIPGRFKEQLMCLSSLLLTFVISEYIPFSPYSCHKKFCFIDTSISLTNKQDLEIAEYEDHLWKRGTIWSCDWHWSPHTLYTKILTCKLKFSALMTSMFVMCPKHKAWALTHPIQIGRQSSNNWAWSDSDDLRWLYWSNKIPYRALFYIKAKAN